jgi:hypothetical protein
MARVDESRWQRNWVEFQYPVDVCRVSNGARVKHLWITFMNFLDVFKLFIVCICYRIIRMIKSRSIRWAGHVARMGEEEYM